MMDETMVLDENGNPVVMLTGDLSTHKEDKPRKFKSNLSIAINEESQGADDDVRVSSVSHSDELIMFQIHSMAFSVRIEDLKEAIEQLDLFFDRQRRL